MKLLPLLKFGKGYLISSHILLGMWLLIHAGIKVHASKRGPMSVSLYHVFFSCVDGIHIVQRLFAKVTFAENIAYHLLFQSGETWLFCHTQITKSFLSIFFSKHWAQLALFFVFHREETLFVTQILHLIDGIFLHLQPDTDMAWKLPQSIK